MPTVTEIQRKVSFESEITERTRDVAIKVVPDFVQGEEIPRFSVNHNNKPRKRFWYTHKEVLGDLEDYSPFRQMENAWGFRRLFSIYRQFCEKYSVIHGVPHLPLKVDPECAAVFKDFMDYLYGKAIFNFYQ